MEIKARMKKNIVILDLTGRIDVDAANFIEIVGQCVHDGYNDILCNFESIEGIDYMGISVLVIAYKEVLNNKGRMKFVHIPVHLKGVFSVAGLDRIIDTYATEEQAINAFKEDTIIEKIKKMQLRRRFKRLPIEMRIELKPISSKKPVCLKGELLNLSGIGAYVYGCDQFQLGDEVILKLKLPPKQDDIELDARVVWLSDKQIQHPFHPGMGIEFYNIAAPVQQKLLDFIERNLAQLSSDR